MNKLKTKIKINKKDNNIVNYQENQLESFIVGDITNLGKDYYLSNMNILIVK